MESKGKIGVLIEEHFDQTEFQKFNEYFPRNGYEVEYMTHLWGNPELRFGGNPDDGAIEEQVTVKTEIERADPAGYKGIICIGAYAMDRLRYEANPRKGRPNQAPAVVFLRKALKTPGLKIGCICHSLCLFCADKGLLRDRKVPARTTSSAT